METQPWRYCIQTLDLWRPPYRYDREASFKIGRKPGKVTVSCKTNFTEKLLSAKACGRSRGVQETFVADGVIGKRH